MMGQSQCESNGMMHQCKTIFSKAMGLLEFNKNKNKIQNTATMKYEEKPPEPAFNSAEHISHSVERTRKLLMEKQRDTKLKNEKCRVNTESDEIEEENFIKARPKPTSQCSNDSGFDDFIKEFEYKVFIKDDNNHNYTKAKNVNDDNIIGHRKDNAEMTKILKSKTDVGTKKESKRHGKAKCDKYLTESIDKLKISTKAESVDDNINELPIDVVHTNKKKAVCVPRGPIKSKEAKMPSGPYPPRTMTTEEIPCQHSFDTRIVNERIHSGGHVIVQPTLPDPLSQEPQQLGFTLNQISPQLEYTVSQICSPLGYTASPSQSQDKVSEASLSLRHLSQSPPPLGYQVYHLLPPQLPSFEDLRAGQVDSNAPHAQVDDVMKELITYWPAGVLEGLDSTINTFLPDLATETVPAQQSPVQHFDDENGQRTPCKSDSGIFDGRISSESPNGSETFHRAQVSFEHEVSNETSAVDRNNFESYELFTTNFSTSYEDIPNSDWDTTGIAQRQVIHASPQMGEEPKNFDHISLQIVNFGHSEPSVPTSEHYESSVATSEHFESSVATSEHSESSAASSKHIELSMDSFCHKLPPSATFDHNRPSTSKLSLNFEKYASVLNEVLTPPRSNESNICSPSTFYPSTTFNSPVSYNGAFSPSGAQDVVTSTIAITNDEGVKTRKKRTMKDFKKHMQVLQERYSELECCHEQPPAGAALAARFDLLPAEKRRQLALTVYSVSVEGLFCLLYYHLIPNLGKTSPDTCAPPSVCVPDVQHSPSASPLCSGPSSGSPSSLDPDCDGDVNGSLVLLAGKRLLAEDHKLLLSEVYGAALLWCGAVHCSSRPDVLRYLVECVRGALSAERPADELDRPLFTQTDARGDTLIGRLVQLGATHAACLAALVSMPPKQRPLFDVEHRNIDGYSALHLACRLHDARGGTDAAAVAHVLIAHAHVDKLALDNKAGMTALHFAVQGTGCDLDIVLTLFLGDKPCARRKFASCTDSSNRTPIDLARAAKRSRSDYPDEVIHFLQKCRSSGSVRH